MYAMGEKIDGCCININVNKYARNQCDAVQVALALQRKQPSKHHV